MKEMHQTILKSDRPRFPHFFSPPVLMHTKSHWTIIHILINIVARVTKFGVDMQLDTILVDLEGQGHGSKVKVTRSKNDILEHFACLKSHVGQGQRSRGSKVTWVKVNSCLKVQGHQLKNYILEPCAYFASS